MMEYAITKQNILVHELIGLKIKIIKATDKNKNKIEGTIVNETKNTLTIETNKKEKTIPKKETIIEIELPNKEKIKIKGMQLIAKPEERTKQLWRKKNELGFS